MVACTPQRMREFTLSCPTKIARLQFSMVNARLPALRETICGWIEEKRDMPLLINKNMLKYVPCANVGETFVVHLRQSGKVNVQGPACF